MGQLAEAIIWVSSARMDVANNIRIKKSQLPAVVVIDPAVS